MSGEDTDMHFLISQDSDEITWWLEILEKVKTFSLWYQNIYNLINTQSMKLTEQINQKLMEILEFCDSYTYTENLLSNEKPLEKIERPSIHQEVTKKDLFDGLFDSKQDYRP